MSAFKLGFVVHVHSAGKDEETVAKELSGLFTAAGESGFDGGWVIRHSQRTERAQVPLAFFGAVAGWLPLSGPDAAVIVLPPEDTVSPAAAELGLGDISVGREAFGVLGLASAGRRELFEERLGALHSSLGGEPHALPEPARKGRMWQSASSVSRAAEVGEVGDGLLLGAVAHHAYTVQRPLAEAYLTTARRPRFGIVRALFPAKDGRTSIEDGIANGNIHHGTTAEVIESLYTDPALLGYLNAESWFLPVVQHSPSGVERLGVIAGEIAPALGWQRA